MFSSVLLLVDWLSTGNDNYKANKDAAGNTFLTENHRSLLSAAKLLSLSSCSLVMVDVDEEGSIASCNRRSNGCSMGNEVICFTSSHYAFIKTQHKTFSFSLSQFQLR